MFYHISFLIINVTYLTVSLQLSREIARKEADRAEMEKVRMELVLEEQEERERQKEMVNCLIFIY